MRYTLMCLAALMLLVCSAGAGLAHRVNVFAYVDGPAIQVECSFSKSQKVRNGKLVITDLETGAPLLEGTTDVQGVFSFQPPEAFLRTGHGLNILLLAGEGHQSDWQITAEELQGLSPSGHGAPERKPSPPEAERQTVTSPPNALNATELEALVGRVVDAKLAPVKQMLARQQDSGPGLRDIVGGLGWILGLLGLATYMKYRR